MAAKRVLISIDERLLARIDESCARRGSSRSGYLARLAAEDLDRWDGVPGAPATGDESAQGPGGGPSTTIASRDR
jgi:hypothetical protein